MPWCSRDVAVKASHLPVPKVTTSPWDELLLPILTKANQPHASPVQGYLQDAASCHELLTVSILQKYNSDLNFFSYFSPVVICCYF